MATFDKKRRGSSEGKEKEAPFSRRPAPSKAGQITETRCSICKSTHRSHIDRMIAVGVPQVDVIEMMAERGEKFTPKAMSNHKRKHMSLSDDVTRRAVERKAMQLTGEVEDLADWAINSAAILDVMRTKAFQKIIDDEIEYTPGDVFSLLDRIDKIDHEQEQAGIDQMMRDLNALLRAIKDVVAESEWNRIVGRWEHHRDEMGRDMRDLAVKKVKEIEAEVVEPKKTKAKKATKKGKA